MTKKLATHAERFAERHRVNGQPNGYRPITEAELQAMKAQSFKLEIEALEGNETRRKAMDFRKWLKAFLHCGLCQVRDMGIANRLIFVLS